MKVSLFIFVALSVCALAHGAESDNDVMSGTYRFVQPQQLMRQQPIVSPLLGRQFISGQQQPILGFQHQPQQWSERQQPIMSGVGASWQQQLEQQPIKRQHGIEQQRELSMKRELPIQREPIQQREEQFAEQQQQPIQQWQQPVQQPAQQWQQQQPLEQAEVKSRPSVVRLNLAPTLRFTSSPSITTSIHSANQFVTPSLTATRHETKLDIPVAPNAAEQQGILSGFGRFGQAGQFQQQQPIQHEQQFEQQREQAFAHGQQAGQQAAVKSGVEQQQQAPIKEEAAIKEQQAVKIAVLSFRPLFAFPVLRKSLKGSMYFEREQPLRESAAALASLNVEDMSDAAKLKLEKFRLKMKMHKLKNVLLATRLANLKMKQDALMNQQAVQKLGWTQQYAIQRDLANKYANQQKFLKMRLGLNALRGRLLQMRVRRFLTKQMMLKQQQEKEQMGLGMLRSQFIERPSAVIRPWMVRHALKQQRIIASMKNRINNLQAQVLALRAKQAKFALKSGMGAKKMEKFGLTELPVEGREQQFAQKEQQAIEGEGDEDVVNKKIRFSFEGIKSGADESDEQAQKRKMNVQFDFSYPKRDEATALARDANLLNAGGFGSIRLVGGGFKSRAVGGKKVTQAGKMHVLLNVAKTVTDLEKDVARDSDAAATDIDERALMRQEKVLGGERKEMSEQEIDERVEAELRKDEAKEGQKKEQAVEREQEQGQEQEQEQEQEQAPVKEEQQQSEKKEQLEQAPIVQLEQAPIVQRFTVQEQEQEQAESDADADLDEQEQDN